MAEVLPWNMQVESVPLGQLTLDPENARRGNVAAIIDSLREFGQHRPIVARRSDGRIAIGNHTYMAAESLGWTHVSVAFVDDDDDKLIRRAIADNATGDLAVWDLPTLGQLVERVGADIPGLDAKVLEQIDRQIEAAQDEAEKPIYPIAPKFAESYNCVVIFSRNDLDWAFLLTTLNLGREQSYKNQHIGQTHVLEAQVFAELWRSRNGFVEESPASQEDGQ